MVTQYIKTHRKLIAVILGVAFLMAGTAAAASYITRETLQAKDMDKDKATTGQQAAAKPKSQAHHQQLASAQTTQTTQPRCDDSNVLGYLAGGAAGGVLGNQVGKGKGNTAATIGGTLGGAYLGGQYIPLKNVTCRQ